MNRRDDIIDTAVRLFARQGYHATSIRQIAAGVGCRESAIYVHFPDGKRELLQTVLTHHMPDFDELLRENASGPASDSALDRLGERLAVLAETDLQDWQWIAGEFPTLKAGERANVRAKLVELHETLAGCLRGHTATQAEARSLAWAVVTALSGYAQLHRILAPGVAIDLSRRLFVNTLKVLLAETAVLTEQANVQ